MNSERSEAVNEIKLSDNLEKIELEINHFKNIAGQSILEIGRRLNHVKENDLVHGEFGKWLEKIEFSHYVANQFMKIAKELPNYGMSNNLGVNALYLIATLPEEDREKEHLTKDGDMKTPNEMTVRELQELKKKNKEQEEKIKELENQKTKTITETKYKVPPEYEGYKEDNDQLSWALKEAQQEARDADEERKALEERNKFIEKQHQDLLDQRKEVDEKSRRYDELTEGIHELEGKMNASQKRITSYKNVIDTIRKGNQFLDEVAGLIYATDVENLKENDLVLRELEKLVKRTYHFADDLSKKIDSEIIYEGEVIDE